MNGPSEAAVEATVRQWQQIAGWDPDEPLDEDRDAIESMRRDMRAILAAAYPAIREDIAAEVLAAAADQIDAMVASDYNTAHCSSPGGVTIVARGAEAGKKAASIVRALSTAKEATKHE